MVTISMMMMMMKKSLSQSFRKASPKVDLWCSETWGLSNFRVLQSQQEGVLLAEVSSGWRDPCAPPSQRCYSNSGHPLAAPLTPLLAEQAALSARLLQLPYRQTQRRGRPTAPPTPKRLLRRPHCGHGRPHPLQAPRGRGVLLRGVP